jgi:hypothetical protein
MGVIIASVPTSGQRWTPIGVKVQSRYTADRVDMLNLLYHGSGQPTVDEKVYAKLIEDEERLEEEIKNYANRRARAKSLRSALRRRRRRTSAGNSARRCWRGTTSRSGFRGPGRAR